MSQDDDQGGPSSSKAGSSPHVAAFLEQLPSFSRFQLLSAAKELLNAQEISEATRLQAIPRIAYALNAAYEDVGEWDLNEQAIEYLQQAIEATSEDELEYAADISDVYSKCMQSRFLRGRAENDMEQAVDFAEMAVRLTKSMISSVGADQVARLNIALATRLANQSERYFARAHQVFDSNEKMLADALESGTEALNLLAGVSSPGVLEAQLKIWSTLGLELLVSYNRTDKFEFLEQSLEYGVKLLTHVSQDEPDARHECLANQAFRLLRAYKHFVQYGKADENMWLAKGRELLQDALEYIKEAMIIEVHSELSKLASILTFVADISLLPDDIQNTVLAACFEILESAVHSMADMALGMLRHDRRDLLTTFSGISRLAAAAALAAGESQFKALSLLERGRAVALSSQMENKRDLDELRQRESSYADHYTKIKQDLSFAKAKNEPYENRSKLTQELREFQTNVRNDLGIPDFESPISETAAVALAGQGQIVVINITNIRSDAIIVSGEGVRNIELPLLKEDNISEKSWEIQRGLSREDADENTIPELWQNLNEMLASLWISIARPVLNDLGFRKRPTIDAKWPRICWILTGPLTLYPIHAAGTGLQNQNNVMNRVISSYAVSLKTLAQSHTIHERAVKNSRFQSDRTLSDEVDTAESKKNHVAVIVMPTTPEKAELPFCMDEASVIESKFRTVQTLITPTFEQVLRLIEANPQLIHFSCHGEVDFVDPGQSKLLLSDWQTKPLTVNAFQDLEVQDTLVAVLSACFTANAGVENEQDEAEHLVSALQTAGFANVVGSLWHVGEEAAFEVMKRFYQRLTPGKVGIDAYEIAGALHFALLEFHETTRTAANDNKGDPVAWAPFVYFGV